MAKELTTLVKEALQKAGLDEGLADKIKVTDISQIDAEIEKLKKEQEKIDLTPEQLLDAIKEAGLEESFKKFLQSETDRRVTQAIATHDLKLKKQAEEKMAKEKAEREKQKQREGMTDEQKKIAELADQISDLTNLVKTLTESTVKQKRETLIKETLKKEGLKEGFSKFIQVEKDEDIPEAVKNLKNEVLELQQQEIDKKLKEGGTPATGDRAGSLAEEVAKSFAEERNKGPGSQPFEGKELIRKKE